MTRRNWLARLTPPRARKAPTAGRKLRVEPLEDRAVPAAPIIDPIPDLTVGSNRTLKLVPIAAADPDGDALTYSARSAGTEAYFLATDLGLKAQTTRPVGWGGLGENGSRARPAGTSSPRPGNCTGGTGPTSRPPGGSWPPSPPSTSSPPIC